MNAVNEVTLHRNKILPGNYIISDLNYIISDLNYIISDVN